MKAVFRIDNSAQCSRPQDGLTLLELLIILAIVGILVAVGLPSFMDVVGRTSANSATRTMANTLSIARSEAVKLGDTLSICATTNGTDCSVDNWSLGWVIFQDNNNDADGAVGSIDLAATTPPAAPPDVIVQVFAPLAEVDLTFTADLLQYNNRGLGLGGAAQMFTFCPQNNDVSNARAIRIGVSGSARIVQDITTEGLSCP